MSRYVTRNEFDSEVEAIGVALELIGKIKKTASNL
jgi:hypothetical protein